MPTVVWAARCVSMLHVVSVTVDDVFVIPATPGPAYRSLDCQPAAGASYAECRWWSKVRMCATCRRSPEAIAWAPRPSQNSWKSSSTLSIIAKRDAGGLSTFQRGTSAGVSLHGACVLSSEPHTVAPQSLSYTTQILCCMFLIKSLRCKSVPHRYSVTEHSMQQATHPWARQKRARGINNLADDCRTCHAVILSTGQPHSRTASRWLSTNRSLDWRKYGPAAMRCASAQLSVTPAWSRRSATACSFAEGGAFTAGGGSPACLQSLILCSNLLSAFLRQGVPDRSACRPPFLKQQPRVLKIYICSSVC